LGSNRNKNVAKRMAAKRERDRVKRKAKKGEGAKHTVETTPPSSESFSVTCKYETPDALAISGPLVTAEWRVPEALAKRLVEMGRVVPPPVRGHLLVDTGASQTCIAEDVARELGLNPIGRGKTFGAHGEGELNKYLAHFHFVLVNANQNRVDVARDMIVSAVPQLNEAYSAFGVKHEGGRPVRLIGLLGRDFLMHTKFTYDGVHGITSMSLSFTKMKPRD